MSPMRSPHISSSLNDVSSIASFFFLIVHIISLNLFNMIDLSREMHGETLVHKS